MRFKHREQKRCEHGSTTALTRNSPHAPQRSAAHKAFEDDDRIGVDELLRAARVAHHLPERTRGTRELAVRPRAPARAR